jgi:hypothetical protein
MASEKFARGVSAIDFKPLCFSMVSIDKTQVMKQCRDIEQFRVKFEILADTLESTERENPNGVVELHFGFMLPHEFRGFASNFAIQDLDAGNYVGHCRTPISICAILRDG